VVHEGETCVIAVMGSGFDYGPQDITRTPWRGQLFTNNNRKNRAMKQDTQKQKKTTSKVQKRWTPWTAGISEKSMG